MKWLTKHLHIKGFEEKSTSTLEYKGLSDFLHHAPQEKKIEVFTEAARRANEDQKRVFEQATVPHTH